MLRPFDFDDFREIEMPVISFEKRARIEHSLAEIDQDRHEFAALRTVPADVIDVLVDLPRDIGNALDESPPRNVHAKIGQGFRLVGHPVLPAARIVVGDRGSGQFRGQRSADLGAGFGYVGKPASDKDENEECAGLSEKMTFSIAPLRMVVAVSRVTS